MSDLSRLFDQAIMINHVETDLDDRRALAESLVKRSGRVARVRFRNTALVAVLAALFAGSGMWLIAGAATAPARPAPTPSDTDGTVPDIRNADWTVDWNGDASDSVEIAVYDPTAIQAPAAFDDGLDHANLPPLVDRASPRYPVAHVLEDWVWDHVGPGWGLATYGLGAPIGRIGLGDAAPRLYLVSPEGIYFEMRSLGPGGPSEIAAWQVADWSLTGGWVALSGGNYEVDGYWHEIQDLRTGAVLSSSSGGEGVSRGSGLSIMMGLSDGAQLWLRQPFAPTESDPYVNEYATPSLTLREPTGATIPIVIPGWESGAVMLAKASADGRHVALLTVDSSGSPRPAWIFDAVTRTLDPVEFPALGASRICYGAWYTIDATAVVGTQCWDDGSDVAGSILLESGEAAARAESLDGLIPGGLTLVADGAGLLVRIVDSASGEDLAAAAVQALGNEVGVDWVSVSQYATGRFAISTGDGITVLYDRASGSWYALTSPIMRDSIYATGLTALAVLRTEGSA